jgi:hypothetical protein
MQSLTQSVRSFNDTVGHTLTSSLPTSFVERMKTGQTEGFASSEPTLESNAAWGPPPPAPAYVEPTQSSRVEPAWLASAGGIFGRERSSAEYFPEAAAPRTSWERTQERPLYSAPPPSLAPPPRSLERPQGPPAEPPRPPQQQAQPQQPQHQQAPPKQQSLSLLPGNLDFFAVPGLAPPLLHLTTSRLLENQSAFFAQKRPTTILSQQGSALRPPVSGVRFGGA